MWPDTKGSWPRSIIGVLGRKSCLLMQSIRRAPSAKTPGILRHRLSPLKSLTNRRKPGRFGGQGAVEQNHSLVLANPKIAIHWISMGYIVIG